MLRMTDTLIGLKQRGVLLTIVFYSTTFEENALSFGSRY
jgi:hypothetical protein